MAEFSSSLGCPSNEGGPSSSLTEAFFTMQVFLFEIFRRTTVLNWLNTNLCLWSYRHTWHCWRLPDPAYPEFNSTLLTWQKHWFSQKKMLCIERGKIHTDHQRLTHCNFSSSQTDRKRNARWWLVAKIAVEAESAANWSITKNTVHEDQTTKRRGNFHEETKSLSSSNACSGQIHIRSGLQQVDLWVNAFRRVELGASSR